MGRTLNRLKAKQVETLGAGRHSDGGGLYLDRDDHGRSRWVFMWTRSGKRREMGLGPAGREGVTLAEAREGAATARETIRNGRDPIEERKAAAAPPARAWTFGEVADEFVSSLSPQWRNDKHRAQWKMTLKTYAAPLRPMLVDKIYTVDVLDVLKPLWLTKPETAARLRGRIERVLDAAKARGLRSGENPARWRGHLDHLLPRRQKLSRGHHAAMPYSDVAAFMQDLKGRQAVAALALEFLILTAARTGEVLGAKWSEFDLEGALWTVPAGRMKSGREHRVPLSQRTVAILKEVRHGALAGSPAGEVVPASGPPRLVSRRGAVRPAPATELGTRARSGRPVNLARGGGFSPRAAGAHPLFEFSAYHLVLACLGLAIILAYWLPRFFSGREPAASALLIGLGFALFGWMPGLPQAISPISLPKPWEIASELCVTIGLFGVGLRIDRLTGRAGWAPTVRLLLLAMPLTILGVALLGGYVVGLGLAAALLLGAVLAPTDPVLAGDVQVGRPTEGGEHPVRFTLTTEAGLNDGLAFPFVHLAMAIAAAGALTAGVMGEWLWRDLAYRVAVGAACGVGVGWLLGKLLFAFPRENALAKTESGVFALAGVLVAYGFTELAEGYGFIAAFIAGVTLRRMESEHEFHVRLHDFSETIEHALTAVLLIAFGAAMPAILASLDLAGAAVALALVFVVRPAVAWLSLAGQRQLTGARRLVVAAYGVRGIGSIYYLGYAGSHMKLANEAQLWAIVGLTIVISTVVHGFTAAFAVEAATDEKQR